MVRLGIQHSDPGGRDRFPEPAESLRDDLCHPAELGWQDGSLVPHGGLYIRTQAVCLLPFCVMPGYARSKPDHTCVIRAVDVP